MPMDFCTTRAALMPVAVRVVDLGLSRALRRSDSVRVNQASTVAASAHAAIAAAKRGSPASTVSAPAVTTPEARPSIV